MTKSDEIRRLSDSGLSVTEIAARLGIRYQHAYNVLKNAGKLPAPRQTALRPKKPPAATKPPLSAQTLLDAGFQQASKWTLDANGALTLSKALPQDEGVYAFVKNELVQYVGVATMGLAKRVYFYARPGISQRTSQRLNETILHELSQGTQIEVLIAQPEDMTWNGLPVHGAAGLELGLIKAYTLPWNMRSAR
ncbi:hypothetical protein [Sandarakinorhabdus sp.]|uniref:hypothetical protein n=1 Tax=Sandarakinorhabdus sp. TaxID=1916663 RepID=UPI00286DBD0E|nr:hypothetical protein [Sandarakinorhabdus sp.]